MVTNTKVGRGEAVIHKAILLAAVSMLVTSFGIPAPAYAGDLLLLYRSASDTEYLFDLENHSTHEILFRGLKSLWSRVIPVDTAYSCRNKSTGVGNVSAFPLMEGEEPSHIKVLPGEQIRLRLKAADLSVTSLSQLKGSICRIQLRLLQPREEIESTEFEP